MDRTIGLLVFSDFVCPFSYLAEPALQRVRDEASVGIVHRAFELWPPGTDLPTIADRRDTWDAVVAPELERRGMEGRFPDRLPPSRKAHEAAAFARDQGCLEPMRAAIFRAHFVEGREIDRIDVLVDVGRGVGLDPEALDMALRLDTFRDRIIAEERDAVERGVDSTPTYLGPGGFLVGANDAEHLVAITRAGGESERP